MGFVPGAGTDIHVYRLLKAFGVKQDLSVGRGEKGNRWVALFIDFKNAYNAPSHEVVWDAV